MLFRSLKPCPFCGSKRLKVCKKNNGTKYVNEFSRRIERHTYSVRCNACYARGGAVGGLVPDRPTESGVYRGVSGEITTDKDLQDEAIRLWNGRC